MSKYLLILKASIQSGHYAQELTEEIQIECESNVLAEKITQQKRAFDDEMQRVVNKTNIEKDQGATVSVSVVQVLPL